MNRDRLARMIPMLEGIHAAKQPFNLWGWASFETQDSLGGHAEPRTHLSDLDEEAEHACGTSACACGYAALMPEFQQEGLRLLLETTLIAGDTVTSATKALKDVGEFNRTLAELRDMPDLHDASFVLTFDGGNGWRAVQRFFDLSFMEADFLFSDSSYDEAAGAQDVADRIKSVLANGFPKSL